jgi:chorismate mutase
MAVLAGCWDSQPAAPGASPAAKPRDLTEVDAALDELLEPMRERLVLMHDVAKWKWNENQPIADPAREAQLLADLEERGLAYGLSRPRTRAFMTAQIEAGKLVQKADFTAWKANGQGKFSEVRDLKTDLRPRIDELSDRLFRQLAKFPPMVAGDRGKARLAQRAGGLLRGDGIGDDVRKAALRPLLDSPAE